MFKFLLFLAILCCLTFKLECVPVNYDLVVVPGRTTLYEYNPQVRPSLGDLISNINWFPIEVNVPDVISNIYSGLLVTGGVITNGVQGLIGFVQRLPLFDGLTSPERPEPLNFYAYNNVQNPEVVHLSNSFPSDDDELIGYYP